MAMRWRLPIRVRKLSEHAAQTLAPLRVDHLEIWIGFLDTPLQPDGQRVGLVDDEVDRQSDRDIRAHGRIERHDRALGRLEQAGRALDHTVDDRLAVLALTDLEIAGVGRRFDEIAFAVDLEQPRRLALDLAADDEIRMRVDV